MECAASKAAKSNPNHGKNYPDEETPEQRPQDDVSKRSEMERFKLEIKNILERGFIDDASSFRKKKNYEE